MSFPLIHQLGFLQLPTCRVPWLPELLFFFFFISKPSCVFPLQVGLPWFSDMDVLFLVLADAVT